MQSKSTVWRLSTIAGCAVFAAACAAGSDPTAVQVPTDPPATAAAEPTISEPLFDDAIAISTPVTATPTTAATTTSTTTTSTTTTTPATTTTVAPTTVAPTTVAPTTTLAAGTPAPTLDLSAESVLLGTSVEGRPIVADRYGTVGGRRVLVIGVIHGNEDGGVPIIDELRSRSIADTGPEGVELWLIESMNPDGQAAQDRHNANQVDLNRNFPLRWGPIGEPGDGQYAGVGPASEPETQAMVAFMSQLRPDLTLWFHQDANLIIPSSGRDGRIRARYAELSGLPVANCCSGGIYTGIAATWARDMLSDQEGVAFIVELPGGDLPGDQVIRHADTVSTIAVEAGSL